jgi:predicted transposase/invertase (TIGR01784 family)
MISNDGLVDNSAIIKYHINLEVIAKKYYNKEELTRLEKIMLMLKLKDRKKLKELAKGDALMEKIYKELDEMSQEKENLLNYSKYELEMEAEREFAKKEGHEERFQDGFQDGSNQEKLCIAKNMLKKDIKINDISEITGLSIDEIERLKGEL